jgi:hypothetical protein
MYLCKNFQLHMTRFLFLLVNIMIGLVACQSAKEDDRPPLSASLYVRYIADQQLMQAEASFYTGDSLSQQPVEFPAGVAFMGSGMKVSKIPGVAPRYQFERPMVLPDDSLRFVFRETASNEPTTLRLQIHPIDSLTITNVPTLQEGMAITLPRPLIENENLVMLFTDAAGKTQTLIIEGPTRTAQTAAPGPAFKDFSPGTYTLSIVTRRETQTSSRRLQVSSILEYYGLDRMITLL